MSLRTRLAWLERSSLPPRDDRTPDQLTDDELAQIMGRERAEDFTDEELRRIAKEGESVK